MRISGILSSSLVNGDGIRYVVFCQGCIHHCNGCHNRDSWDLNGGLEITPEELASDILKHTHIDGVTLSGGDPFCQHDECVKLLELLPSDFNIWIYTGYKYEDIRDTQLSKMADVIVDGKFEMDKLITGKPYGSSNQRIINIKKNN